MSRGRAARLDVSIVVLAKDTSQAKTRLASDRSLAQRVAIDLAKRTLLTVAEAATATSTFVVTSDPELTAWSVKAGINVVREGRPVGINAAASLGRRRALATNPHQTVAVMVADLPELRRRDLELVIAEHADCQVPLFVADHHGDGTTCLVHGPRVRPGFGFGRGSADMHRRLGYVAAQRTMRGLRRDLDTPEDLRLVVGAPWVAAAFA